MAGHHEFSVREGNEEGLKVTNCQGAQPNNDENTTIKEIELVMYMLQDVLLHIPNCSATVVSKWGAS